MSKDEYTLDDLKKATRSDTQRRHQRYQLARELGFSSQEATRLQGRSEESIRRLANLNSKKKQEGK